jgi:hypothetical protein
MLRLYAIVLTVLALFTGTAVYVTAFIGIRSATVVAVVGLATTLLTVVLVSLERAPPPEPEGAERERDDDPADVGLGLRHAHDHR